MSNEHRVQTRRIEPPQIEPFVSEKLPVERWLVHLNIIMGVGICIAGIYTVFYLLFLR
jgi:hypothetical protein